MDIASLGNQVIITHGNGPQVGMIYNAMSTYAKIKGTEEMPFAECGAMSEGYIGYHLQQATQYEIEKRHMRKRCVTVATQVVVDPTDPGFKEPTKPIGEFLTKEEAEKLSSINNWVYKEDAGRGYRRVVASPLPQKIVELKTIEQMVEDNNIVIACGGGGIPVIDRMNGYKGVDAVIDKDKTSALLAKEIDADVLLILTAVDKVKIHFNTPDEVSLDELSLSEAKEYMEAGEFAKGSMLPKVDACVSFIEHTRGDKKAIISSLKKAVEALQGKSGTTIIRRKENGN
jgi:carbamate kinase